MSRWTDHERVAQLAAAMCNHTITDEEVRELDAILAADDDACAFYVDLLSIEAELPWTLGAKQDGQGLHEKLQLPVAGGQPLANERAENGERKTDAAPSLPPSSFIPHPSKPTLRSSFRTFIRQHNFAVSVAVSFAVLTAVVGWMAFSYLPGVAKREDKPAAGAQDEVIARLVRVHDIEWSEGGVPKRTSYKSGDWLAFTKGLVEIQYRTGARVVIEGPAEFVVGGTEAEGTKAQSKNSNIPPSSFILPPSNSGYLARGKLVARCNTKASQGFTIATPGGTRLEDIGTEFGVEVDERGAAEFVVISGAVDVISDNGEGPEQRIRLVKDQGAFVAAQRGKITMRKQANVRFVAAMQKRLKAISEEPDTVPDVPGTIFYDSFESPSVSAQSNVHVGLSNLLPAGWKVTGGGAGTNHESSGRFSTPFGSQAAWSNSGQLTTTPAILADVLKVDTTYTLSFNVAKRTDLGGNYRVDLLAGDTVLASATGTLTRSDFSESNQIVFTPDASHAELLGQPLVIRLGTNGQLQPQFDNVRLVAESDEGGPLSADEEPRISKDKNTENTNAKKQNNAE